MSVTIPRRVSTILNRLAGLLLAVGLVFASGASIASAATPPPPPELYALVEFDDGSINMGWRATFMYIQRSNGIKSATDPGGSWGVRFNVYIEQTGERVHSESAGPFRADEYDFYTRGTNCHPDPGSFLANHGSAKETRYCITLQGYVGDGTEVGSMFSAESPRKCVGTQKVLIETPSQGPSPFGDAADKPAPPPPPTKPDLSVTQVTGPTDVFDGATAVYEVVLWNDGTPAPGTAQVQIGLLGPIQPVGMSQTPDGFTCDANDFGFACIGSLGGVDDPVQVRGATFKVQIRGNGSGSASVYGDANHDRALDEMTVDNNVKQFAVTVKSPSLGIQRLRTHATTLTAAARAVPEASLAAIADRPLSTRQDSCPTISRSPSVRPFPTSAPSRGSSRPRQRSTGHNRRPASRPRWCRCSSD